MFLFSVLSSIYCKSHFSKPQKGTVHFLAKNTSNSLNSFPAIRIPKSHVSILYKSSEGYFLLDTLPIPTGFWRRHNHLSYSLCSAVSQITTNLNCKSCSVCRAGGARTPWKPSEVMPCAPLVTCHIIKGYSHKPWGHTAVHLPGAPDPLPRALLTPWALTSPRELPPELSNTHTAQNPLPEQLLWEAPYLASSFKI